MVLYKFNKVSFMKILIVKASVELQGIKGMWSLRSATDDLYEILLVVSFISETRI